MLGEDKTQIFNLIDQLKPDIICLEEEKESQKLIAKLEEEKAKMLEFELK